MTPSNIIKYGAILRYGLNENDALSERAVTWNQEFAMLFVDNPVGTGYSYSRDQEGYSRDQESCARNLRKMLIGFYKMFPEAKKRELWVTGESYAGKYVPALSHHILEKNREVVAVNKVASPEYLPIAGMAVGNGLTDPISQEPAKPVYAWSLGLIDFDTFRETQVIAERSAELAKAGDWLAARAARSEVLSCTVLQCSPLSFFRSRFVSCADECPPARPAFVHPHSSPPPLRKYEGIIRSKMGVNPYDIRTFEQYQLS